MQRRLPENKDSSDSAQTSTRTNKPESSLFHVANNLEKCLNILHSYLKKLVQLYLVKRLCPNTVFLLGSNLIGFEHKLAEYFVRTEKKISRALSALPMKSVIFMLLTPKIRIGYNRCDHRIVGRFLQTKHRLRTMNMTTVIAIEKMEELVE